MIKKGSCLCETIRFEVDGNPLKSVVCYCRECQKAGGTDSVGNVILKKENFSLTAGQTAFFTTISERGNEMERHFCPACGTPLFTRPLAFPNVLSVRAANFDDSSWFNPEISIYCSSALTWSLFHPSTVKFERHQK